MVKQANYLDLLSHYDKNELHWKDGQGSSKRRQTGLIFKVGYSPPLVHNGSAVASAGSYGQRQKVWVMERGGTGDGMGMEAQDRRGEEGRSQSGGEERSWSA